MRCCCSYLIAATRLTHCVSFAGPIVSQPPSLSPSLVQTVISPSSTHHPVTNPDQLRPLNPSRSVRATQTSRRNVHPVLPSTRKTIFSPLQVPTHLLLEHPITKLLSTLFSALLNQPRPPPPRQVELLEQPVDTLSTLQFLKIPSTTSSQPKPLPLSLLLLVVEEEATVQPTTPCLVPTPPPPPHHDSLVHVQPTVSLPSSPTPKTMDGEQLPLLEEQSHPLVFEPVVD